MRLEPFDNGGKNFFLVCIDIYWRCFSYIVNWSILVPFNNFFISLKEIILDLFLLNFSWEKINYHFTKESKQK